MLDEELYLSTYSFLEEIAENFPEDTRKEQYEAIYHALSKIKFSFLFSVTTTKPITDEIVFESLLRRIAFQLERIVIGKTKTRKLPLFAVIEKNTDKTKGTPVLHGHILIGDVIGQKRSLKTCTLRNLLSKTALPALIDIRNRLTHPNGQGQIGKIGVCDFTPIIAQPKLIDYVLKRIAHRDLNIAWSATNIDFQSSASSHSPKCQRGQNRKKRKAHTQSRRSLIVP